MSHKQKLLTTTIILMLASIMLIVNYLATASQQKTALLFFDDGWENQLEVLHVLQQYGFNATFAIIANKIDTDTVFLNSKEIKNLSTQGYEIASHSYSHQGFTALSNQEIISELTRSKNMLENITGKPVQTLVYPYCATNSNIDSLTLQYYSYVRGASVSGKYVYFVSNENMEEFVSELATYEANNLVTLCYHQIGFGTTLTAFTAEMNWLYDNGYRVVSGLQYKENMWPQPTVTASPLPTSTVTPTTTPTVTSNPSSMPTHSSPSTTASPTPTPTCKPTNMTVQDWENFYSWLMDQQTQKSWGNYLEDMFLTWRQQKND